MSILRSIYWTFITFIGSYLAVAATESCSGGAGVADDSGARLGRAARIAGYADGHHPQNVEVRSRRIGRQQWRSRFAGGGRDGRDGEMAEGSSVNDGEMAEVRAPVSARAAALNGVVARR
ncbi:hypothetical protein Scep_027994 [Stephania cephalantha]|uniref:Uncharacterized protein n=1 Tax=Stephania cephalantha TaxID=152367 RepID=A0AAP0ECA7_9MAGN